MAVFGAIKIASVAWGPLIELAAGIRQLSIVTLMGHL
jgi:hypothetical protein